MFESINAARKTITVLGDALAHKVVCKDAEIFAILAALLQVFDIAEAVDLQGKALTPKEISDIGEQGLTLIDNLVYKLVLEKLDSHMQDAKQVALVIAQWVILHHGRLTNIQSVVDGLAYLANALQDKSTLAQLATFMGQVARACDDAIKYDLDNSNPMRPWRILNINRGIVATRSHDLALMRVVFSELSQAIPMDAPGFFKEGLSEMVRFNYPETVGDLMQEFCDRAKSPVIN